MGGFATRKTMNDEFKLIWNFRIYGRLKQCGDALNNYVSGAFKHKLTVIRNTLFMIHAFKTFNHDYKISIHDVIVISFHSHDTGIMSGMLLLHIIKAAIHYPIPLHHRIRYSFLVSDKKNSNYVQTYRISWRTIDPREFISINRNRNIKLDLLMNGWLTWTYIRGLYCLLLSNHINCLNLTHAIRNYFNPVCSSDLDQQSGARYYILLLSVHTFIFCIKSNHTHAYHAFHISETIQYEDIFSSSYSCQLNYNSESIAHSLSVSTYDIWKNISLNDYFRK